MHLNSILDSCSGRNPKVIFLFRFMKILPVFLLATVFSLSANTLYSQNALIKINRTNVPLETIIQDIESQSDYMFVYKTNVDVNIPRTINVSGESIDAVLSSLLKNTGLTYTVQNNYIILAKENDAKTNSGGSGKSALVAQQLRSIKGVILDKKGDPVIGAAVLVRRTEKGVATDLDGRFEVNAEIGDILEISSIGFKPVEIPIRDYQDLTVIMEDDTELLEATVVVGYGVIRKSDLTGAVSSINAEQFKERSNSNVLSSLAGQIAGVQIQQTQGAPGTAPTIKVRGTSTVNAGSVPLFVIDGFPMENFDMGNLNPNDIESIEILKDASSAAIYGSRGANGVIMITTKNGKAGETRVDASYDFGIQKVQRTVDVMDSQQFIQFVVDAHNNSWVQAGGNASDPNSARSWQYRVPQEFIDSPQSFATTDWQDVVFRTAFSHNAQVAVSGGTNKTQFRISGGFLSQDGVVDNSFYKRISVRSNINHQILDNLKIGLNLDFARINKRIYGNGGKEDCVSLAQTNDPIFPVVNENGNYGYLDPNSEWYRFNGYGLQLWHPYAITREIDKQDKTVNVMATAFLEWNIIKDLTFRTSINASMNENHYSDFRNEGQKYGWSNIQIAQGNDRAYHTINWLSENTLNYQHEFGKHSLNALLGFTAQKNQYEYSYITSQNFPNNMIHTLNAGKPSSGGSQAQEWSMISYIGRINYNYARKYLLTATLRRDGCSRFGYNSLWGYFPSVSAAWKIDEEPFMDNIKWISSAKVRVSYGVTGNNQISNYGAIGTLASNQYAFGTASGNVEPGLYLNSISNPNLRWEKTGQTDIGLNVGLFGNRIYFEADYYNSITKDMLLNVPVPSITGFTSQLTNIGQVRNRGFEFLIQTKNIDGEFTWDTSFNISFNRNTVLKLGPSDAPIYLTQWGTTKTEVGQPIANYFGYVFDGVFKNQSEIDSYPHHPSTTPGDPKVVDVNGDGTINDADRTIIGNAQPDFQWGLTNTFTYKGFDLTLTINGSVGNEIMNSSWRFLGVYNGARNAYSNIANYWRSESQPGDGIHFKPYLNYPGMQNQFSTMWIEDGSFLRIANLRLGYTFPRKLLRKTPISDLRLYVNVDNLHVFSSFVGYDPENSVFSDSLNSGNDYGAHPIPRTITFGLRVSL